VIATRLLAGQTQVQVLADAPPDEGFEAAPPNLEDVYFSALSSHALREERTAC
jgi:hypothetical protein